MAALLLLLGASFAPPGAAKDRKPPAAYAVIAGTVFRDTGMSLAGASVELRAAGASEAARKFKPVKMVSDGRGEFAFHVPANECEYKVKVQAAGFASEEKTATVAGEQRIDVFFQLTPASK